MVSKTKHTSILILSILVISLSNGSCHDCSVNIELSCNELQYKDPCNPTGYESSYYNLTNKNLTKIPSNITNIPHLILDLEINHIKGIKVGQLSNVSNSEKICLDKNKISDVESFSLQGLNKLKVLSMKSNFIKYIHNNMWKGLNSLQLLFLDKNRIKTLQKSAFLPLKSLFCLSLSENQLRKITSTWDGLTQLQGLDFYGNKIYAIAKYSFSPLKSLFSLDLGENKLSHNLLNNGFSKKLPYENPESTNKTFSGTHSHVKHHMFSHLRKLTNLSIETNKILKLTETMFNELKYLKNLDLSYCQIRHIEIGTFLKQACLVNLNLHKNRLVTIFSGMWDGLIGLRKLSLEYNVIERLIGKAFEPLQSLGELNLNDNIIAHLNSNSFWGLFQLRTLKISQNNVIYIRKGTFKHLIRCEKLHLQCNRISQIADGGLDGLKSIHHLDLRNNKLQNLYHGMIGSNITNDNNSILYVTYEQQNITYGNFCICQADKTSDIGKHVYLIKKLGTKTGCVTNTCDEYCYKCCHIPGISKLKTGCARNEFRSLGHYEGYNYFCMKQEWNFSITSIQHTSVTDGMSYEQTTSLEIKEKAAKLDKRNNLDKIRNTKKVNEIDEDSARLARDRYLIGMSIRMKRGGERNRRDKRLWKKN